MAMEKDLEKSGGAVNVVSKESHSKADEIYPISKADEMTPGKSNSAYHRDMGIELVPKEALPDTSNDFHQIDRDVNKGASAIRPELREANRKQQEGNKAFEEKTKDDPDGKAVRLITRIYERNLDFCAVVLLKDCMRARECSSIGNYEVLRASVQKHAEAMRDCQSLAAFQKSQGVYFTSPGALTVARDLAWLQWLEESTQDQDLIESNRKSTLEQYPLGEAKPDHWRYSYNMNKKAVAREANIPKLRAFGERFFMSLFGGYILVVPMLIMTLHPTLLTALLTTSVFVIAVAVILAIRMETAQPKDLLGIAAAYAAVLVVFVGTATTNKETLERSVVAGIVVGVLIGGAVLALPVWYFFYIRKQSK